MKDFMTVLATFIGLFIAWSGVHTWKKQLSGTDYYKDLRIALKKLFEYRESIKTVRRAATAVNEIPDPTEEEKEELNTKQLYASGLNRLFEDKLRAMTDSRQSLESALLDVEVSSKKVDANLVNPVLNIADELVELSIAFRMWVNPDSSQSAISFAWRRLEPQFDAIVPKNIENDEFATTSNSHITTLEKELRYRLKNELSVYS